MAQWGVVGAVLSMVSGAVYVVLCIKPRVHLPKETPCYSFVEASLTGDASAQSKTSTAEGAT